MALPITVRGTVLGVVDIQKSGPGVGWSQEQIALVETIVEQLGLALDSARLFQDAQRRAAREQLVGEITARMQRAVDVDALMQNAIQELQTALAASYVSVSLGTEDELLGRLSENLRSEDQ